MPDEETADELDGADGELDELGGGGTYDELDSALDEELGKGGDGELDELGPGELLDESTV